MVVLSGGAECGSGGAEWWCWVVVLEVVRGGAGGGAEWWCWVVVLWCWWWC